MINRDHRKMTNVKPLQQAVTELKFYTLWTVNIWS